MELSSKAVYEIKDLMDHTIYLSEESLYQDMFDILKANLDFFNNAKLCINDRYEGASFNIENKTLFVNPEENYYYAKKYAYSWMEMLKPEDIEDFTKYAIPLTILHEVTHGEQTAFAYEDYSEYPEINRLYRRIFDIDEWWNLPMRINYVCRGDSFSFERYANLNAFKEVLPIVPLKYHEILKMEYLYNYLKNYNVEHGKIVTPARKTFKMIWGKYDIIDDEIPLNERIIHGLDLNSQEYNEYIFDIDSLGIDASTYDVVQKKLGRK